MLTSRILSTFQGFRALSIRNVARDLHTTLSATVSPHYAHMYIGNSLKKDADYCRM